MSLFSRTLTPFDRFLRYTDEVRRAGVRYAPKRGRVLDPRQPNHGRCRYVIAPPTTDPKFMGRGARMRRAMAMATAQAAS